MTGPPAAVRGAAGSTACDRPGLDREARRSQLTAVTGARQGEKSDMSRKQHASWIFTQAVLALGLAGCGLGGPAHGPASPNAAAVVDMGFMSFEPATVHIRAGQTVEWRNTSLITHSVTDDSPAASDPKDASIPVGATPFSSGDIPAGHVFTASFPVPGTYKYLCTHHEGDGMLGTVVVAPAS